MVAVSAIVFLTLGFGLGHLHGRRTERKTAIGKQDRRLVLPTSLVRKVR